MNKIRHTHKSKHKLNCGNHLILLMITDGKKWHYLTVKKLSALLRGITSNHNENFDCINYLHTFKTKNKLKIHKNVCENHDYCHIGMLKENNKILKHKHVEKSMKVPFVIYADLECLLQKINIFRNNSEKSSTAKNIRMNLLVIHCLHIVHLMLQKINLINIEAKTV